MIAPMRLSRPLLAVIVLIAASWLRAANAQDAPVGFKMPSNNIYCLLEPPYETHDHSDLRCDLQQMTSRPPRAPKDCPLSWGDAFEIAEDGNMGVMVCHGDTTRNDTLMVLDYGKRWSEGGFLCESATSGLTCTNAKGHGFMLSRAVQKLF